MLDTLLAHKELAILAVAVLAGGIRTYRQNGTLSLRTLPWRAIERLILTLRRSFFTVRKPDTVTIQRPISEVREAMVGNHFEDGWILSYRYHGEDANLRRPAGKKDGRNQQTHVRLWKNDDDTTDVKAHIEASPLQHPGAHIREKDFEDVTGQIVGAYSKKRGGS